MFFVFYPEVTEIFQEFPLDSQPRGTVAKEIKRLSRIQRDLYLRVTDFLKNLEVIEDVQSYFDLGYFYNLRDGLYEMRIPPERKGGVFRIYFCYEDLSVDSKTLILLDAELKHETAAKRLDAAKGKLKQYKGTIKLGEG